MVVGETATSLVYKRAPSSKKNYIVASCDVTVQGSVNCQQPQSDVSNQGV